MSKAQLKKHLSSLSKEEIIQVVSELYEARKEAQEYLEFYLNPNAKQKAEEYKEIICNEFFPERGDPECRFSVCRKAISDFKELKPGPEYLADLMLYYIETGCEFISTYGDMWEQFYTSMKTDFDKAMSLIATIKPNKRFHNRIEKMLRSVEDCGWDFADTLRAIYDSYRSGRKVSSPPAPYTAYSQTPYSMNIPVFIRLYKEAFGEQAPLPLLFSYSDTPLAVTEKTNGCFFKALQAVREGVSVSLNADVIGCGGGKFYTGFSAMPEHVPHFVSVKERYKQTPGLVLDYIRQADVRRTDKAYLNFVRLDRAESFDRAEGLLFFATPDRLSGLCTWAFYDTNDADAVTTLFGSGCANVVTVAVQENRRNGHRTFVGLFDPSVRPYVGAGELSFVIPSCRFRTMYRTLPECALFGTHAWAKVKARIDAEATPPASAL